MKRQPHDQQQEKERAIPDNDRRGKDRRKDACEGYTYIQMVGWMDRRERARREGDCYDG